MRKTHRYLCPSNTTGEITLDKPTCKLCLAKLNGEPDPRFKESDYGKNKKELKRLKRNLRARGQDI